MRLLILSSLIVGAISVSSLAFSELTTESKQITQDVLTAVSANPLLIADNEATLEETLNWLKIKLLSGDSSYCFMKCNLYQVAYKVTDVIHDECLLTIKTEGTVYLIDTGTKNTFHEIRTYDLRQIVVDKVSTLTIDAHDPDENRSILRLDKSSDSVHVFAATDGAIQVQKLDLISTLHNGQTSSNKKLDPNRKQEKRGIFVVEESIGERAAKAIRHAIKLCGGKGTQEPF